MCEGLEGRSKNPVSVLFDVLLHPNADIGERLPSSLEWAEDDTHKCSHVVLGCGKPGGIWHRMEHTLLTLSLQHWLDLPIYSFEDWKQEQKTTGEHKSLVGGLENQRAAAKDIAQYYTAYIKKMNLTKSFVNGILVHSIKQNVNTFPATAVPVSLTSVPVSPTSVPVSPTSVPVSPTSVPVSPTSVPTSPTKTVGISNDGAPHGVKCSCDRGVSCPSIAHTPNGWIIRGRYTCCSKRNGLVVRAKKLVLACGLTRPKALQVPGEEYRYVIHTLSVLQSKLHSLKSSDKPVVVVGAGISAADAILMCLRNEIHVYHVFYQSLNDNFIFTKLPHQMYHEYHRVWHLMQGLESCDYYTALQQHRVKEFRSEGHCILNNNDSDVSVNVSAAIIMIGSQANIDFLPEHIRSTLAMELNQPIDSKHNQVDVDLYTSQSERFPTLYALGPLVGDNFVRLVYGSGLACARDILYNTN